MADQEDSERAKTAKFVRTFLASTALQSLEGVGVHDAPDDLEELRQKVAEREEAVRRKATEIESYKQLRHAVERGKGREVQELTDIFSRIEWLPASLSEAARRKEVDESEAFQLLRAQCYEADVKVETLQRQYSSLESEKKGGNHRLFIRYRTCIYQLTTKLRLADRDLRLQSARR